MSDLVNEVYDVEALLVHLHSLAHAHTRLVVNFFNHLWRPILTAAESLGLKSATPSQNWLSTGDMVNLLQLAGWEVVKTDARMLWPLRTPVWATLCNRWLAPLLRHFCLTVFMVARPAPHVRLKAERKGQRAESGGGEGKPADALGRFGAAFPAAYQGSLRRSEEGVALMDKSGLPGLAEGSGGGSQAAGDALVGRWPLTDGRLLPAIDGAAEYSCSVIVPVRSEAGNVEELVDRTPELGRGTEIIFVEGGSQDETWGEVQRVAAVHPHRNIKILKQTGRGKGQAVRQGFAAATGDILLILDADLSVPPEELPKFYEVLRSGTAEFVNGVRSVYPMQQRAMRFCNMIGNKLFSLAFGFILGQPVKDTLCGTKALFRSDYAAIAQNRAYFGDVDPFGDFDLLFGAAKLNLRIVDLPVHYCARSYGETNILRWRHGWLLLKMTLLGARKLKFVK